MSENKNLNTDSENTAENKNNPQLKVTAPPPVVSEKEAKRNKKTLIGVALGVLALVVVIIAVVIIKNSINQGPKPVVVTDANGVPVTDENGEPVTYIPETQVVTYTDKNGEVKTTVVIKDNTTGQPVVIGSTAVNVTDENGEVVTDQYGHVVTTVEDVTSYDDIIGTTIYAVTDGQGNTMRDEQGNVYTTSVQLTTNPFEVAPAEIEWKSSRGGTQADYFSSVAPFDGGYISAVVTNSKDGTYSGFSELGYATPYTVLTKYKENGDVDWEKAIGSARGLLVITAVVPDNDGGFYAVGYGKNIGGKAGKGNWDGAVFKFDKKGNEVWSKVFGTSTVDLLNGACLTADGGIVAVGSVGNNDGDAAGFDKPQYQSAACIVKYSSDGSLVFKNIIGGNEDTFNGVCQGTDGGIYCIGNFYSGTLFENLGGARKTGDSGIVKFSSSGKYLQVAPIAGEGHESFTGITACKNGGVAVVGRSNSSDAGSTDSVFVSDLAARGGYDSYIFKYNNDLTFVFATPLRGQYDDNLESIVETEDGKYIVAGYSNSSSRDFKGITTRGGNDMVIACFTRTGSLSWARSFGGTNHDSASAICLANDGGYVVAGRTLSKDIDMKGIAQYVNGKSVGVIVKFPQ